METPVSFDNGSETLRGMLHTPGDAAHPGGTGVVFEMGQVLEELVSERAGKAFRATIVAPIKPGMRARVLELIEKGPPFDPGRTSLERHAVYLTERDAVFAGLEESVGDLCTWSRPVGGLFIWVGFPDDVDQQLLWNLARERGVLYARGAAFHVDGARLWVADQNGVVRYIVVHR